MQPVRQTDDSHVPEVSGKRLLVAIPALDEARTLGSVIAGIPAEIRGVSDVTVVVVDDGALVSDAKPGRPIKAL